MKEILAHLRVDQWIVAYLVLMIPVGVSLFDRLRIHGELLRVSLRATLQLVFIALVLVPVFTMHWIVQILLVLVMISLGALIAAERGKDLPGNLLVSGLALLAGVVPVMVIILVTGAIETAPYVAIPVTGMFVGNASRTVGLLFHRTRTDFEAHQEMMEAMMLDGADYREAMDFPMQATLRNALVPRIDSLKTLGIVHIPGAMAGMMIAGAHPIEAAGYQLLIFFGIVATAALAAMGANRLMYRRLFTLFYPHLGN